MRIIIAGLIAISGIAAQAQTWEKYVAPGLTYRMEVDLETPRIIHAFRYSLGAETASRPELAGLVVYSETSGKGRETLGDLVKRTHAIAGINGDFFPFTGDPLGIMVRGGELISALRSGRAAFGWGGADAAAAIATGQIKARIAGELVTLDGLNQECGVDEICLNTEAAGGAIAEKGQVAHAVIKIDGPALATPRGSMRGHVIGIVPDARKQAVSGGTVVLTASGKKLAVLNRLQVGDEIAFSASIAGFDWTKIEQVVGGGPFLIREAKVYVDWERQGFNADFALKRHPRSAVGRTVDGDLWFVAIDGRQSVSDGATLDEEAQIMLRLGCVDAINLDGGGSTTIDIGGATLNRPSDGEQRPIANAVLFFARSASDAQPLTLHAPAAIAVGETAMLKVYDQRGEPVPTVEVIWSSQGKAWIDQGGALRGIADGDCWIAAYVRGQVLLATVKVNGPTPSPSD